MYNTYQIARNFNKTIFIKILLIFIFLIVFSSENILI